MRRSLLYWVIALVSIAAVGLLGADSWRASARAQTSAVTDAPNITTAANRSVSRPQAARETVTATPAQGPVRGAPATPRPTSIPVVDLNNALPGFRSGSEDYAVKLESSAQARDFNAALRRRRLAIQAAIHRGDGAEARALHRAETAWKATQRARTLAHAKSALAGREWTQALRAYKRRIALGEARSPALWWGLAQALAHREGAAAKAVGYAAFRTYELAIAQRHPAVAVLRPALALLERSLAAQKQRYGEIRLLEAIHTAYPADRTLTTRLRRAILAYGLRVRKVTRNVNRFPTQVCVAFTAPLSRAPDFHASTWVWFTPVRPHAVAVREHGGICVRGLPAGATTTLHVRAGLPAILGVVLAKPLTVRLTLPGRAPKIIVDTGRFILPANLPAAVGFSSINISTVKLRINRVPQRALLAFVATHPLLNQDALESHLEESNSVTVWRGTARVPHFRPNRLMHTVLPLPKILARPGLYAIEISPGDGTPNPGKALNQVQLVLRTNLAPTVWQGRNGLTVQVRHFTTAEPWAGVRVKLIAIDNAVLETARSTAAGLVHFAQPILQGGGGEQPAALHLYGPGGGFTLFDLQEPGLNLSGRGISGRTALRPVSPYLWLDRGIYRPGETVHVSALYRSASGQPLNLPLHLIVRRPGGQVFCNDVPKLTDDDSIVVPIRLPDAAQDGTWSVSLASGLHEPALAEATFTVAAFVPPSLAVHLGKARAIPAGRIDQWPVTARYLYGAPGAHLGGRAEITLHGAPVLYRAWRQYHFGLSAEVVSAPVLTPTLPPTNASGRTEVPIDLRQLPDSTRFLQAHLTVSVNEPSGRAVSRSLWLPIVPDRPLLGIAEGFHDATVGREEIPRFRIAAIAPDGREISLPVQIQVVRQSPLWNITLHSGVATWGYSYVDHPVLTRRLTLPAGEPYRLPLPVLAYGRYRLRVIATNGSLAASSLIFYSGWQSSDRPGVPQRVSVRSSAAVYSAGSRAHIHVSAPFAGPAVLVVANDKILSVRNFRVPERGTTVSLRVHRRWGAGAYAVVDVFRPATARQAPERAIGLTWLGLKAGHRAIPVHIDVDTLYRPRERITIPVQTRPGAYVTVAAVDQGILNLTQFPNPDPLRHFFGKRRLDIRILDEYGALLARPEGFQTLLENGAGANFGAAVRPIPQKVVALFAGPVRANRHGLARLTLRVPQFDGQLHLMAVTWKSDAVGAEHANILVRNRLIARLLLPRFLAPGDEAEATLLLQNLALPAGLFHASVTAGGPVTLGGGKNVTVRLRPQALHLLPLALRGTGEGTAELTLTVTGPQGYHLVRHWSLVMHSTQIPTTVAEHFVLAAGARRRLTPQDRNFISGSVHTAVTVGNTLPFNPRAYVQALYRGWQCPTLLTAASRGLPLTVLRPPLVSRQRLEKLQHYVDAVLNYQRYDGAFGLWSDDGRARPWLSAYATEFLLRAQKVGATVPNAPVRQALQWLRREVENDAGSAYARIYAVYDLSLAGEPPAGAIRLLAQHLSHIAMPLPLAQLGASLAAISERHEALRALHLALTRHEPQGRWWWKRSDWAAAFGSPLRDAWAVPAIVAQTGLLPQALPQLRENLPGAGLPPDGLTAQELSWALYADGVLAGAQRSVHIRWGRQTITKTAPVVLPLTRTVSLRNLGTTPLPIAIATTGISRTHPGPAAHGMTLRRQYYTLSGAPISPTRLRQNQLFVVVLRGAVTDGLPHRALVDMGLPPGWELAGSIAPGRVPHLPWLHGLTTPQATAATDDRYEAAIAMAPTPTNTVFNHEGIPKFTIAILMRAVTPGSYALPGVRLDDLFHPAVYARTAGQWVTVEAPRH